MWELFWRGWVVLGRDLDLRLGPGRYPVVHAPLEQVGAETPTEVLGQSADDDTVIPGGVHLIRDALLGEEDHELVELLLPPLGYGSLGGILTEAVELGAEVGDAGFS